MLGKSRADECMEPVRDESAEEWEVLRDADPAKRHSKERENQERSRHRPGSLVRVFGFLRARFSEKSQCDLAHCIERGQERGKSQCYKDCDVTMTESVGEYFVLRPK